MKDLPSGSRSPPSVAGTYATLLPLPKTLNSIMRLLENKTSLVSAIISILALIAAVIALEGKRKSDGVDGVIWPYFAPIVRSFSSGGNGAELSSSPAYPFTDVNLIVALFILSVLFSVVAIAFGFLAKKKGEYSLIYAGPIVLGFFIIVSVIPLLSYF